MRNPLRFVNQYAVGTLIVLAILIQFASWHYQSPMFPGPYEIVQAVTSNFATIYSEMWTTIRRSMIAFLIATTMIPFGIWIGRVKAVGMLVDPILEFLTAIPPAAVIPLVMLFAGLGDQAKIVVILYAISPLILVNAIEGARNTAPMLTRVARSFRLSAIEQMILVDLPSALPAIFVGLRLAISTSVLVSVTSEMLLATDGIGTLIQRSQESFDIPVGVACLAAISLTGMALNLIVRLTERRFLFWYYRA